MLGVSAPLCAVTVAMSRVVAAALFVVGVRRLGRVCAWGGRR